MSQRIFKVASRVMAALIFVNLVLLMGCGGEFGVTNGAIVGKVFSNLHNLSATRSPEAGVTVVAQRETTVPPPVTRVTTTDANGNFTFSDMPTGNYVIGYAKEGFKTIDTQAGATSTRTAVGSQVRVVIDSGQTAVAPDVTLVALQQSGDATVIVTVLDRITGKPVLDANVTAGPISQSKNTNGVYSVTVPIVRSGVDTPFGNDPPVIVTVRADGFKDPGQTNVRALAGETARVTVVLTPLSDTDPGAITFKGTYRFTKFQNLLEKTPNIKLSVKGLDERLTPGIGTQPTAINGTWSIVGLPPSTPSIQRKFDFVFEHPDLVTNTSLHDEIMPRAGTQTIADPVFLEPITVKVAGTVTISPDAGVTLLTPKDDERSVAIITETGQQTQLIGGSFTIPGVPVRQMTGDVEWTLRVFAVNPNTNNLFKITDQKIKPISTTGINNPEDTFVVGPLQANTLATGAGQ